MNYYIDTEFYESGAHRPIELISLGIVSWDGRELYIENADVDLMRIARESPWLKENVLPHLTRTRDERDDTTVITAHANMGQEVLRFIGMDPQPRFWGYFADYDWVLFAQLFGSMITLPPTFPHMCLDLRQEMVRLNVSKPTIPIEGNLHNALDDARWTKKLHEYLITKGGMR
jgi:hypothetical protein